MKIALIGFGVMGKLVAGQARKAGDEVGSVFTSKESVLAETLQGHDVAVDFSVGEAVLKNIEMCARAKVPLVEGTTGWKQHESEARRIVDEYSGPPPSQKEPALSSSPAAPRACSLPLSGDDPTSRASQAS